MSLTIIPLMPLSLDQGKLPNLVPYAVPTVLNTKNALSTSSYYMPPGFGTLTYPLYRMRFNDTVISGGTTGQISLAISCALGSIGLYDSIGPTGINTRSVICTTPSPTYLSHDTSTNDEINILVDILKAINDGVITADMALDIRCGSSAGNGQLKYGWSLPGATYPYTQSLLSSSVFSSCPSFASPDKTVTLKLDGTWS